jgi:hypothetical protein
MGDRASITLAYEGTDKTVELYTHWSGYQHAKTVADALERGRSRWLDGDYLARIIAVDWFKMCGLDDLTGAGLGVEPVEDVSLIIQVAGNEVVVTNAYYDSLPEGTYTFDEFIELVANRTPKG